MTASAKRPASDAAVTMPASASGRRASDSAAASGKPSLKPEDYTENPTVKAYWQELVDEFGPNMDGVGGNRALIVSDVLDEKGQQYVNLVQKGGGVLGIALVGYTYILEKAGIRFVRMAGTSAGAINTALLTAVGDPSNPKAEAKSRKILEYISDLQMFSFVDGHPFARWLIRNIISDKNFMKRIKKLLTGVVGLLVLLFLACLLLLGLEKTLDWPYTSAFTRAAFVLTGFSFLLTISVGYYLSRMLSRLRNSGYGINPGNAFLTWIKEKLDENGVGTIDELNRKAGTLPPLRMRDGSPLGALKSDVTFITSELVSQNKVEFPKMWELFRPEARKNELHPGEFVRASMSIPFFFESHIISGIPDDDPAIHKAWQYYLSCPARSIPKTVRFVDGGVLSNFPINIFYNPDAPEARLPSLGIDLDDTDPEPEDGGNAASWSLGSYSGRMLNTIRYYYDKDFLLKNGVFNRGIGTVKLQDPRYNWLDFFIADKTKIDMFAEGAKAATKFLKEFDWEEYKSARREMREKLKEK